MPSRRKKIFLALLPYILILLLLVTVECVLRYFAPSLDNPLVHEVTYDGIEWYQINRSYLKKYFPADTPLIPEFKTSLFKKHKGANTLRIFCLGESSMFGTPYQMTCNIPGIVRKQLRHLHPEKEIEVVNWGASAINTNVIADLSAELVRFQPDLVLVYTGHNEFYGPDGVGASFIGKYLPFTIPLKYYLRDLRLVTVLYNAIFKESTDKVPANLNLMEQVFQGNAVRLNSEAAERVFRLYTLNLKTIVETFKASGVPIIVSDVSSNLTFQPFIADSLSGGQRWLSRGTSAYMAGRYQEAIDTLQRVQALDSTNAAVNFWLGKSELALGQFHEARRHMVQARDNDLLKFRAPSRINHITRQVALEESVPFVSSDSLFSSLSDTGIAGDDLFWEHLHPTALGYYSIATLFVQEIVRLNVLKSERSGTSHSRLLPFDTDSLSICWLDEAYGDLSVQHLTGRWPFAGYHRVPKVFDSGDASMRQIAVEAYSRKVNWDEACYKLAAYCWQQQRTGEARTIYEAMLEEYPYSFYTHYLFGSLLNQQGDVPAALMHYRKSIELNSRFPNSRLDVGLMQINRGDFEGALKDLSAALDAATSQTSPQLKANIHYGLSAVYANKGEFARALEQADAALRFQPGYRDAMALRERIVHQQQ